MQYAFTRWRMHFILENIKISQATGNYKKSLGIFSSFNYHQRLVI